MKHFAQFLTAIALLTNHACGDEPQPVLSDTAAVETDIAGLWLMGQSLCEGAESLPVVTPTDSGWGNYRFQRGVRTWVYGDHGDEPEKRSAEQFAFVPLSAAKYGGLGETIANGMADHLQAAIIGSHDAPIGKNTEAPRFLVTYAGQGGRFIDELSSVDESTDLRTPATRRHGGGYYRTSLDDARRAKFQAQAMGKHFAIAALIWMQGEANGGPTGGINPNRWDAELSRPVGQQWYRDRLINYRQQWSDDLRAITGQAGDIPLFTYQTQGAAGEAQLLAADQDSKITLVGPHYMIPSGANSRFAGRYGDPIHMSADGERWYGEQVGKVIHRVLREREAWQPLRPQNVRMAAGRKTVLVDFHVPRPPLVLEESFLPREQYPLGDGFHSLYGFQIRDADRAVSKITAVEVASPTRVRIRLAEPLKAHVAYTLDYGLPYAGQLGTIASIRNGPLVADQPTKELLIHGSIRNSLKPLLDEGTFFVTNMLSGDTYARAPVRHVTQDNEALVLRFENRELRNNTPFVVGQTLTALRGFSYGNLRDSDPEKAIFKFADPGYGARAGQSYPLWNWCVLFQHVPIAEHSTDNVE